MKTAAAIQLSFESVTTGSLLERVMMYQNSAVVSRLMNKLHLDEYDAILLFEDTKRFLYLCGIKVKGDPSIAPPEGVDSGWHEFLMFTEDYQQFCESYFGRFIHHRPRRPEDPAGDGSIMRDSRALALATFGQLSLNWQIFKNGELADCNNKCNPSTNCQDKKCQEQ